MKLPRNITELRRTILWEIRWEIWKILSKILRPYRRSGLGVKEVIVPDIHIWPTDYTKTVKRYVLADRGGAVWINGSIFGLLTGMVKADRSSSDCRDLLRDTPEDAAKDQNHWYHFEKQGEKYVMVEDES